MPDLPPDSFHAFLLDDHDLCAPELANMTSKSKMSKPITKQSVLTALGLGLICHDTSLIMILQRVALLGRLETSWAVATPIQSQVDWNSVLW